MTIGFSQKINGKPNFFVEKIHHCLSKFFGAELNDYIKASSNALMYSSRHLFIGKVLSVKSKKHTLRKDPADRWRKGAKMHMVINNRTKNRFQFAPVVTCSSVQTVEIKDISDQSYLPGRGMVLSFAFPELKTEFKQYWSVRVDGRELDADEISQFAINDGFDDPMEFFLYFQKGFKGKIIHWTDLRY